MMQDRLIWFNGSLMPSSEARVPVMSPTAQFGLNVFEGIRGYWSATDSELYLFRLPEHLDRLRDSCRLIGIESPWNAEQITDAIREVVCANAYRCDIAVRVTLFVQGDEGSWSSSEPVGMFVAPIAKDRKRLDAKPLRACTSTWERIDDRSMPPRVKCGANYVNGRYAHLEAQANGFDVPILLDRSGKVSEGAGSCVMIVRDGALVTPPTSSSILESITRSTLLEIAAEIGVSCDVRPIDRTELYLASELFLCGSAAEITPIGTIDRFDLETSIGPVTARLLDHYQQATDGRDAARKGWLTSVWTK